MHIKPSSSENQTQRDTFHVFCVQFVLFSLITNLGNDYVEFFVVFYKERSSTRKQLTLKDRFLKSSLTVKGHFLKS